ASLSHLGAVPTFGVNSGKAWAKDPLSRMATSSPATHTSSAMPCSSAFNTLLASSNISLACVGSLSLGNAQATNFAPRVGFAFRMTDKLVARGGFGTAYGALGNLGYGGTLGTNYPFVYTQSFPSAGSQHPILLPNNQ